MNAGQLDIFDAIAEPIAGDTKATVDLVAHDWQADEDWHRFTVAVHFSACGEWDNEGRNLGTFVDPNDVRAYLAGSIEPRRYSAFWHRASKGKDAFLVADGWVTNTDHAGGNAGKPLRRYRLRAP
jgi:hypothetical protein